ncbi:SLC13 family permease [Thermovenabulum sp.]|uniref:SLC13 family permease n=1 Tax=Thermovenabulum sp. TaxID=3100335 RepID=UPI003C7C072A
MINQLKNKVKEDAVFIASFFLALLSCFISPPKIEYIDFKVLLSLFNLMVVVEAFKKLKILEMISINILDRCNTERTVSLMLMLITFLFSMLVTNDVALITFVPLSLIIAKKTKVDPAEIVIFQTLAANIGSSLTPMGNPQNLFLYSKYNIKTAEFFKIMFPFAFSGFIFLILLNWIIPNKKIIFHIEEVKIEDKKSALIFTGLFAVILLSIFNFISYLSAFIITLFVTFIFDKKLFKRVDYILLFTFVFFFIFIGNLSHFEYIKIVVSKILDKPRSTFLASITLSQFISNVPCAIFLSGFTTNYRELLLGVDIGGMGTLIASLASVISYKIYTNEYKDQKRKYLIKFSLYNFSALILFTLAFLFFI